MNLSSVTPPGVLSAQLSNPREFDPRNSRDFGSESTLWSNVQYTFNGMAQVDADRTRIISPWIEAVGTSFQLLELEGATSIGVRFDTVGTFFKMQDGDIFEGSFSRVQFKPFQKVGAEPSLFDAGPFPDVVINAIASNGGRLIKAPRREGMTSGFQTWTGPANSSSGTDVLSYYETVMGATAAGFRRNKITPGAGGGQIVLKNTGTATLYLYTQNTKTNNYGLWYDAAVLFAPNTTTSFPLEPGETITIPLRSRLQSLMVATSGGSTGSWAAMADSMGDMTTTGEATIA